jgi:hypothetical protein
VWNYETNGYKRKQTQRLMLVGPLINSDSRINLKKQHKSINDDEIAINERCFGLKYVEV